MWRVSRSASRRVGVPKRKAPTSPRRHLCFPFRAAAQQGGRLTGSSGTKQAEGRPPAESCLGNRSRIKVPRKEKRSSKVCWHRHLFRNCREGQKKTGSQVTPKVTEKCVFYHNPQRQSGAAIFQRNPDDFLSPPGRR